MTNENWWRPVLVPSLLSGLIIYGLHSAPLRSLIKLNSGCLVWQLVWLGTCYYLPLSLVSFPRCPPGASWDHSQIYYSYLTLCLIICYQGTHSKKICDSNPDFLIQNHSLEPSNSHGLTRQFQHGPWSWIRGVKWGTSQPVLGPATPPDHMAPQQASPSLHLLSDLWASGCLPMNHFLLNYPKLTSVTCRKLRSGESSHTFWKTRWKLCPTSGIVDNQPWHWFSKKCISNRRLQGLYSDLPCKYQPLPQCLLEATWLCYKEKLSIRIWPLEF